MILSMPPAHGITKGVGRPTHHYAPTLKPVKKLFPATPFPASESKQGKLFLVLTLLICSLSLRKALPKFLV